MSDNFKYMLVDLLSYCIVINKQIHSNAFRVLQEYCTSNDIDIKETHAFDILGDVETKPDMNGLINRVAQTFSDIELESYKEWVCLILTADSNIDHDELQLVRLMSSRFGWSFKKIQETLEEFKNRQLDKNKQQIDERTDSHLTQKILLRARKIFTFDKEEGAKIQQKINRMVLNGKQYGQAIRKRSEITEEDVEVALKKIESTEASLNEIKQHIIDLNSVEVDKYENYNDDINEADEEYQKIKKDLSKHFEEKIPQQIKEIQNLLIKKRKAALFFSIAFIGRTKAGKSTLHSLLTNEGEDFIGVGKQRTTRFNRVYENNLIRIIDTPGLNAVDSDDGGRRDEEIALSIVDEVDVICYLVTNDNIEENEFKFLQSLRQSQKKVIILLNYKKNIVFSPDGVRFPLVDRFVTNPLDWYYSDGDQNIQGHINRVERWVSEYYDEKFVTIIPVHLQSAQLSQNDNFREVSDKLYEGSRFDVFKDELTKLIVKEGSILGSKTILNDSSVSLYRSIEDSNEAQKRLEELLEKLVKDKEKLIDNFKRDVVTLFTSIDSELKNMFSELNTVTYDFADRNWDQKEDTIQRRWKNVLEDEFDISKKIKDIYTKQIEILMQDVSDRMQDISDSLDSMMLNSDVSFTLEDVFDTKRFTQIFGGGLGVVGSIGALFLASNPITLGLIIFGTGLSLISGLFKSKATKRRENTESILKMTHENIESIKEQVLASYPDVVEPIIEDITAKILDKLDTMVLGIHTGLIEVKKFNQITIDSCQHIDRAYAKRLLSQMNDSFLEDLELSVERIFKNNTVNKLVINSELDIPNERAKEISDIVQHEIEFNNKQREIA